MVDNYGTRRVLTFTEEDVQAIATRINAQTEARSQSGWNDFKFGWITSDRSIQLAKLYPQGSFGQLEKKALESQNQARQSQAFLVELEYATLGPLEKTVFNIRDVITDEDRFKIITNSLSGADALAKMGKLKEIAPSIYPDISKWLIARFKWHLIPAVKSEEQKKKFRRLLLVWSQELNDKEFEPDNFSM